MNADGTFAWAKSFENSSWDHGKSIVIDNSGNIYTTGYFQGTADFDLGAGTFNLTSAGNANTFISKLNADGTFAWAKNFGNTYSDSSSTIAVDSSGNVYTTGFFSGTADFDPGSGTFNLTSSAEWADNFISKLNADGTFAWAKSFSINSNNYEAVHSIAVDDSGNVYTTGDFQGTTDFDPGPGTFNLTPVGDNDAFISKLNADGTFAWAKNLGGSGGDYGYSIAVDNSDNVYTAGSFGGTVDFDPGPGAANLTSAGKDDIFISKLNADGTFAWSKSFGGSSWDFGSSVDIDSSGNIYTTGYFSGTADFDPGPGTFNLTSAGNANPFISKLNPDGTFAWAKNLEGSGNNPSENFGFSIDIDNSDNVYTTGYFQGTVDFDPGTGTANLTSTSGYAGYYDVFISKLTPGVAPTVTLNSTATATVNGLFTVTATFSEDVIGFDISDITIDNGTAGNFTIVDAKTYTFDITPTTDGQVTVDIAAAQATDNAGNDNIAATPLTRTAALNSSWTKSLGGSSGDFGKSIAVDNSGNVYTIGSFYGTADFDPGAGTTNLTASGQDDIFISKLNADGTFAWAQNLGNIWGDSGYSVAIDNSGNIYTTGSFWGKVDFDPGVGTFNLTATGQKDTFISKLNADGTFAWAKSLGGSGSDIGKSIAVDDSGNVYTTGTFQGTADFNPGTGTFNLTAAGSDDTFISKLNADGTFAWAKNLGGSGSDSGNSIAVDNSGNVYTTGTFQGTADFNPGVGTTNLTSAGGNDTFISKLNADGTFGWAKNLGSSGDDSGRDIAVDITGNVYTTGGFRGTVDFDPGVGTDNLTSAAGSDDIFISKLNADGTFGWAKSFSGSLGDYGNSIDVDITGNVYTTGQFQSKVDFDPGVGTFNLTSAGGFDHFISKLNADGTFAWAESFEGVSGNIGNSIAVDSGGTIYTTGQFKGTVDFDPGVGTDNLTAAGDWDVFISKLDPTGIL
ncbi:MAG TPA: SBBP repeat-containing protein [Oscillatoriaceae cyanobacterium M33_DOE_052]|nr:SBBP repeat-containing protein [Oscillatoriaceae cyanobacterium M33_DOE_052]